MVFSIHQIINNIHKPNTKCNDKLCSGVFRYLACAILLFGALRFEKLLRVFISMVTRLVVCCRSTLDFSPES